MKKTNNVPFKHHEILTEILFTPMTIYHSEEIANLHFDSIYCGNYKKYLIFVPILLEKEEL